MMRLRLILLTLAVLVGLASGAQATYTQQYLLSQDSTFQNQVSVAMIQSCANAMTEVVTQTGHVQRMQLCVQVLQNPTKWTSVFSIVLASQSNNPMTPLTVPSTVADALVQTASDAQLSNVAGYYKQ